MQSKQKNKQKDILFILISSFIVVVAWIGFNLYHIWATSTVSQDVQAELTPIDPVFDPQTIEQLKTRENINPLFESQASASATLPTQIPQSTPTPQVTSIPSPTSSITVQPTPSNSPINRVGQ
jgi:hypothetical protein